MKSFQSKVFQIKASFTKEKHNYNNIEDSMIYFKISKS